MLETELKYLLNDIAASNSRASFKRVYLCYYDKLFWLAKSYVKADEVAEEVTNDVFMNLWTQRARLPEINNFSYYCYTAIKNKSLTSLSKKQPGKVCLDDMKTEIADTATTDDRLNCADLNRVISNAVNKLSDQCKVVFKLVKEDGLKYREVADLLDISVKTVEYHMGNALKQVAQAIARAQKPAMAVVQQAEV